MAQAPHMFTNSDILKVDLGIEVQRAGMVSLVRSDQSNASMSAVRAIRLTAEIFRRVCSSGNSEGALP